MRDKFILLGLAHNMYVVTTGPRPDLDRTGKKPASLYGISLDTKKEQYVILLNWILKCRFTFLSSVIHVHARASVSPSVEELNTEINPINLRLQLNQGEDPPLFWSTL
jgi:hypothetical protein